MEIPQSLITEFVIPFTLYSCSVASVIKRMGIPALKNLRQNMEIFYLSRYYFFNQLFRIL